MTAVVLRPPEELLYGLCMECGTFKPVRYEDLEGLHRRPRKSDGHVVYCSNRMTPIKYEIHPASARTLDNLAKQ